MLGAAHKTRGFGIGALLKLLTILAIAFFSTVSLAGIVINAAEFDVAKFHRIDNQIHPYTQAAQTQFHVSNSAWLPFILPNGATANNVLVQKNADGSYSIFFRTLTELFQSIVQIANQTHQTVTVLNVHAHGLPGIQGFAADSTMLNSSQCSDWWNTISGPDQDSYQQYYSPVPIYEIQYIRQMADAGDSSFPCASGLTDWQSAVTENPAILRALDPNVQIHFLSCEVGLGTVGNEFTAGIAKLFVHGPLGRVVTATNFGLGDWSMPEGMGFWDDFTTAQTNHDNSIYPVDRKDREIMKPGTLRIAILDGNNVVTGLEPNQLFMQLGYDTNPVHLVPDPNANHSSNPLGILSSDGLPVLIRMPHTTFYQPIKFRMH